MNNQIQTTYTDDNICVICKINLINILYLPCGHAMYCSECFYA